MSEVSGESTAKMASKQATNVATSGGNSVTHSRHADDVRKHDASRRHVQEDGIKDTSTKPHTQKSTIMAPVLRVEHDDGAESSVIYCENENPASSHGYSIEADASPSVSDRSDQEYPSAGSNKTKKLPEEFVEPDEELRDKIISQVEFYFSDENILKDAFLLKHVRRNKQGYVNIKLITSFKKVKSLTRDYRVVAYSLKFSKKLDVNEEETKVCRLQPLPEFDETTPSRTVVAVNLPMENPSIANVSELFKGDIALVRILRPGKTIPGDIKKHSNKHPEIGNVNCAVIEFETHESANEACNMSVPDESGMRVALLAAKQPKKDKNKPREKPPKKGPAGKEPEVLAKTRTTNDNQLLTPKINKPEGSDNENKSLEIPTGSRRNKNRRRHNKDHLAADGDLPYSSGSEIEMASSPSERDSNWRSSLSPGKPDMNRLSPASTPGSSPRGSPRSSPGQKRKLVPQKSPLATEGGLSPRNSPKPSPLSSPESNRRNRSDSSEAVSPGGSPWVQRRLKAAKEISPLVSSASPSGSPLIQRRGLDDTARITRQPRGPDGTRGFTMGRGKPVSVT